MNCFERPLRRLESAPGSQAHGGGEGEQVDACADALGAIEQLAASFAVSDAAQLDLEQLAGEIYGQRVERGSKRLGLLLGE